MREGDRYDVSAQEWQTSGWRTSCAVHARHTALDVASLVKHSYTVT
jgi:hypothetical protein